MLRLFVVCLFVLVTSVAPTRVLAFDDVEDPESIDAVDFQIVEEDFQDMARPRVVMRITVEQGPDEEVGAAIAQSLRDGLANNGNAVVAMVFAYYEGDDTQNYYTAGIGMASEDGKGWTGDGSLLGSMPQDQDDEDDKVFVVVGGALDDKDDLTELIFPFEEPERDN